MKFLILGHARSGSTWLVETLNNIPSVNCYGEQFLNDKDQTVGAKHIPRFPRWKKSYPGIRPFVTFRFLKAMFDSSTGATGFKLMSGQAIRYSEILLYAALANVRVIHLVRKNYLHSAISYQLAKERGKWHYKEGEEKPAENKVEINIDLAMNFIERTDKHIRAARKILNTLRLLHIEVYYEELAENPEAFREIWDFLGKNFDVDPPHWEMKKIRKNAISESISNFNELRSRLEKSKYARFLEEG